jgi:hypothetical protein
MYRVVPAFNFQMGNLLFGVSKPGRITIEIVNSKKDDKENW